MAAAAISRARDALWRVWAAAGPTSRSRCDLPVVASASRHRDDTDATGIGAAPASRPRAASPRPETGDLTAAAI